MKKALLGTDKNVMFIAAGVACLSTECREGKRESKKKREKKTTEKSLKNKKTRRQEILCRFEQKRQTPDWDNEKCFKRNKAILLATNLEKK